MAAKWNLRCLLRLGLRSFEPRHRLLQHTPALTFSLLTRNMGRGRMISPHIKKVFNDEGEEVDYSRLSNLKQALDNNETMIEDYRSRKPKSEDHKSNLKNNGLNSQQENLAGKPKKKLKHRKEEKEAPKIMENAEDLSQDTDDDMGGYNFFIPHYNKIDGWEKKSSSLKMLGKVLTSRRKDADVVVLEGTRLINDALSAGFTPLIVAFSRVKLLKDVDAAKFGGVCECYHVPYNNIRMWSDLTTPTGLMAAFEKASLANVVAANPLPITLICDNIRTPDNLGAILRLSAAAGVGRVLLMNGCCNPWNSKVLRAAAGAHFLIPIIESVKWENIKSHLPAFPQTIVADILWEDEPSMDESEKSKRLEELELESRELEQNIEVKEEEFEEEDLSYKDEGLTAHYRKIPLPTSLYSSFHLKPGYDSAVVLVGGETEGVSNAAYKFVHQNNGERLFIPLRNNVNSLNVISATSVILFKVQEAILKLEEEKRSKI